MTLREFDAAWYGHIQKANRSLECIRGWIYDSARWHASATAWSTEQSKQIGNYRFPHEGGQKANEPLSYDAMVPMLNQISQKVDDVNNG